MSQSRERAILTMGHFAFTLFFTFICHRWRSGKFKGQRCQLVVVCYPGLTYIFNFWHSGTLVLSPERQSARMSEIKNVGYTWMAQNTFTCNRLMPLRFKGLTVIMSIKQQCVSWCFVIVYSCYTSVLHLMHTTAFCEHLPLSWRRACREFLSRKSQLRQHRGQMSVFSLMLLCLSGYHHSVSDMLQHLVNDSRAWLSPLNCPSKSSPY